MEVVQCLLMIPAEGPLELSLGDPPFLPPGGSSYKSSEDSLEIRHGSPPEMSYENLAKIPS